MRKCLLVLLVLNVFEFLNMRTFFLFLPLLGVEIGATTFELGLLSVAGATTMTLALIPFGMLLDRFHHEKVLLGLAILGQFLVMFLTSQLVNVIQLFINATIFGICLAMETAVILTQITMISPKDKRGTNVGTYTATTSLGWMIGALLGGYLITILGSRLAYVVIGIPCLIGLVIVIFYKIPNTLRNNHDPISVETLSQIPLKKRRVFSHLHGSIILHTFAFAVFYYFIALYVQSLGGSPIETGIADATAGFAGVASGTALGIAADRYGGRKIFLMGMYLDILVLVLYLIAMAPVQVYLIQVLNGFNGTAILTGLYRITAVSGEESKQGQQMSASSAAFNLGTSLGPILGGFILELSQSYFMVLIVAIIITLVSNIWAQIFIKPDKITSSSQNIL